jgi:adenylate kinase family enzyme
MKIEIIYNDIFESSCQLLINKLAEQENYQLIDFGDLLREHISSKTKYGIKLLSFIDEGKLIPAELTNEIVSKKIEDIQAEKVLLKNYPKSKQQIDLFIKYCYSTSIIIKRAWHMVSVNVLTNLEKVPKYSNMAAKYKSHDYIKMNFERSNQANKESIQEIGKFCQTIIFESESHGINYENDKIRINNHT